MRSLAYILFLALAALTAAFPITPSAPEYQRLVEQMRSKGMKEHAIAEQLALPLYDHEAQSRPVFTSRSTQLHTLFHSPVQVEERDMSGDIAPGSLEAPQMLPRAAVPETLGDTIKAILRGEDRKRREFGYEGKELELRRPEGMRHWGANAREFAPW